MPNFKKQIQKIKSIMNYTLDKCVRNIIAIPNPAQYTSFYKYKVQAPKWRLVWNLSEMLISYIFWQFLPQAISCLISAFTKISLYSGSALLVRGCADSASAPAGRLLAGKYGAFTNNICEFCISDQFLTNLDYLCFYNILINFGRLRWIWNGYDMQNPFLNCQIHRFFQISTFVIFL